jgi:hypothetical protein
MTLYFLCRSNEAHQRYRCLDAEASPALTFLHPSGVFLALLEDAVGVRALP